jgi:hypothetical protein
MALLHLLRVSSSQPLIGSGIHREGVGAREGDARRARVLAGIGRVAEFAVRFGLRPPLGLQCPAAHEGEIPVAPALLIEPDDEAATLVRDQRLGEHHLLAAVARHAVEDVGTQVVRVHAAQDVLSRLHLAHHQGDALPVLVVIEELSEQTWPQLP